MRGSNGPLVGQVDRSSLKPRDLVVKSHRPKNPPRRKSRGYSSESLCIAVRRLHLGLGLLTNCYRKAALIDDALMEGYANNGNMVPYSGVPQRGAMFIEPCGLPGRRTHETTGSIHWKYRCEMVGDARYLLFPVAFR